ncbi:hypothetical protein N7520_008884 [Penicillium odoratum]|uniref:uncharacterized protein n=1 Tax=Penicillium odoratum TaxID=1167516 RepID=UPI0025476BDA|nr:uncharacterized protein N7520_008884 [Penicillium odoratum]KAJ5751967.1 hypothetical protein N7520_008884 [Penicillium odoratum]
MGIVKLLLKVILIPIVIFAVIIIIISVLIRIRRDRKKEEKQINQRGFQLPPLTEWTYPDQGDPVQVQKPAPLAYPITPIPTPAHMVTPSQMESGYARPC